MEFRLPTRQEQKERRNLLIEKERESVKRLKERIALDKNDTRNRRSLLASLVEHERELDHLDR